MNKRFWISVVVVFVVFQILDGLVHGLILGAAYDATAQVWRPQEEMKLAVMILVRVIFSFAFVYVFARIYGGGGFTEGIRYGFLVSVLVNITYAYGNYAILSIPISLAHQWFVYGTLTFMIVGAVLAKTIPGKNAVAEQT